MYLIQGTKYMQKLRQHEKRESFFVERNKKSKVEGGLKQSLIMIRIEGE